MNLRPITFLCAIILCSLAIAACTNPTAVDPPLKGATIGGPFSLTDGDGKTVTDRSFAGKYRIMYFGYTYCPDVCPTTAQTIGAAMRDLDKNDPALAAKVVPVFVTVDPERDGPAEVKQFVTAFYPRFVGLTGSVAAIAAMKKTYGVFSEKGKPTENGGYLVEHSNATYLMDADNKPLALLPTDQGTEATANEIKRWVK